MSSYKMVELPITGYRIKGTGANFYPGEYGPDEFDRATARLIELRNEYPALTFQLHAICFA